MFGLFLCVSYLRYLLLLVKSITALLKRGKRLNLLWKCGPGKVQHGVVSQSRWLSLHAELEKGLTSNLKEDNAHKLAGLRVL